MSLEFCLEIQTVHAFHFKFPCATLRLCGEWIYTIGMNASVSYLNELSSVILKSAIAVHREMGPGLLEGVYQQCMILELRNRGLVVNQMVQLRYKGILINK